MNRKLWLFKPIVYVMVIFCTLVVFATFFVSKLLFWIEAALLLALYIYLLVSLSKVNKDINEYLQYMAKTLDSQMHGFLPNFPLPVVVSNDLDEIIWYNKPFESTVIHNKQMIGSSINILVPDVDLEGDILTKGIRLRYEDGNFKVYMLPAMGKNNDILRVFYFLDETELRHYTNEFFETRLSVAMILLDSYDELLQDAKDSEKTRIIGAVEETLEKFSIEHNCYLSRTARRDRYIAIIEERHLKKILEGRFRLLDDIRELDFPDLKTRASVSIGVGRGAANLTDAEKLAEQALEMALGRGGDQAAVKTENGGFEFFGGIHKGVEKRTRVKSRIVASALKELIMASDNVMVMGHRYADIDSLGSAVGMARFALSCKKPTYVVLDPTKNLATALLKRVYENGHNDLFVAPPHALKLVKPNTLLIIVDTHVAMLTESPDLLNACKNVVIIDHHRKMVGHIEDTRIFFHEPNASSASEMVTELLQYSGDNYPISPIEAEALLAGITLDTKNFVMGTGVRTFEAAAYLRKMGADTIEVKKIFSGSMSAYQKRTKLVSSARIYKNCAIAGAADTTNEIKIVAPQTADELLNITGVDASFVMYDYAGEISISARSLGKMNVQLIMEKLGGGGHHTMAGTQLKGETLENAMTLLEKAIDEYYDIYIKEDKKETE
ncbi:MAG: DHH family phosphoesterase [Oscillospiraceae bacterium]|nr:DHH family phosphoesterase [Oscillospiraceae bacterium]MBQ9938879.1 DHH family phosphoesterase [Oscillospiraceae bacterium]